MALMQAANDNEAVETDLLEEAVAIFLGSMDSQEFFTGPCGAGSRMALAAMMRSALGRGLDVDMDMLWLATKAHIDVIEAHTAE